ncbi:MAG: hypothetical protein KatS3mg036_0956 [Ignavibacterium sp.]|uniref:hypothetical protein n=1 Tax=Ignavibacterium sp. TaxID=2651167 RepID=UPI0021DCE2F3|nr:hypothetical protein [Ignavibacterium sp.]BDQ03640.1 MAG: hypothetical protein KatS3mg037_2215 [Ignavibacterium sp.]GIV46138.1 MAG: hypothetical protein KatS3mg036_0956 [Ignavibacterium sp.]
MVHGNHWESVINIEEKGVLSTLMKKILKQGIPSDPKTYSLNEGNKTFKYYTYPDTNLRFIAFGIRNSQSESLEIINSIPFCYAGTDIFLKIDEVYVDSETYEAIIQSSTIDGIKINFYDPLFLMNMDVYMKDTFRIFRIAGLAYSLFKTKPNIISLIDEKVLEEAELKGSIEHLKMFTKLKSENGTAFYNLAEMRDLPYNYNLDDCFVQSFIEEVSEFELEKQKIYQLKLSIGHPEKPIKLFLYATEKIIESGYKPQVGDNIYSYIWMQGYSTH